MFKGKKAVLFDLDGTLVDSMWMWRSIDIEYLGRFGIELPPTLQKEIEGMSFEETAHYFDKRFDISDTPEQMMEAWNSMAWEMYRTRVPFKPGAKEFVHMLHDYGVKLGIATSNSRELVELVLDSLHARDLFDSVHTASEVPKGKPAPDIYRFVADELQCSPKECIVFEDVPRGIEAGKNAGMEVCSIEDAFSVDYVQEKKALSDYYIQDYYEILDEVKKAYAS